MSATLSISSDGRHHIAETRQPVLPLLGGEGLVRGRRSAEGVRQSNLIRVLRRFGIFALLAFISLDRLLAADPAADFASANELYAKGKFADAAALYENILHTNGQSASLWFNLGNAEFKAGHPGLAIAAYRQAELLTPRDPELRANLAFVRNQVQGAAAPLSRWQTWLASLTLNEGTWLTVVLFWVLLALLVTGQFRPALAPRLRGLGRLALALFILSGAVLAWQAFNHFGSGVAVVTSAEATARTGPFDDAQSAFTAHDGAELRVLDRHDNWVQVSDGAGKIGWFSRKQVDVLPGA